MEGLGRFSPWEEQSRELGSGVLRKCFPEEKHDKEMGETGRGNNFTDRVLSLRLVSATEWSDPGQITLPLCASDFSNINED